MSSLAIPDTYASSVVDGDISWDKITSIEFAGYEHVYDIEVEGTHNFVAGHWIEKKLEVGSWKLEGKVPPSNFELRPSNSYFFGGIIAHNTYISTNVGIATTNPVQLLQVGTSPNAPLVVTAAGNVGIGTTTPGAPLEVVSSGTGVNYFSAGNVGIGTTNPVQLLEVGTSPTPGLVVTAAGKVGVGTTNPTYHLHVAGTGASQTLRFGTNLDNLLPAGTGAANQILKTAASGAISWYTHNNTYRINILGWNAVADTTGNAFFEPYPIKATNDNFDHLVAIFNDTATRIGFYGAFDIPQNYVDSANLIIHWTSTAITGDVEWDFDYRAIGGDNTESLDQATNQESVNLNDTAPSAVNQRMTCTIDLTDGNFAAGDTVEFGIFRDGTDVGDTIAAAVIVHSVLFEYNGS